MKVFICHSSEKDEAALAEDIATRLRSEGYTVFFDRTDLPAAETYDKQIRDAIRVSDLFLFLLSPNSIKPGSYTLSELTLVRDKWPDPTEHVLPVMVAPTPIESIPPYIRAVSILEPPGNKPAEVLARIDKLSRRRTHVKRLSIVAALAVAIFALVVLLLTLLRADKIFLIDSDDRRHVTDPMELYLQNLGGVKIENRPIQTHWPLQAKRIAKMSPSIVVIHFHALERTDSKQTDTDPYQKGKDEYESEENLLHFLNGIQAGESGVSFIIFSSSFSYSDRDNKVKIQKAVDRTCEKDKNRKPDECRADMKKVLKRIITTPWSDPDPNDPDPKPEPKEAEALYDLIVDLT